MKVNDILLSKDVERIHFLRGYVAALKWVTSFDAHKLLEESNNEKR